MFSMISSAMPNYSANFKKPETAGTIAYSAPQPSFSVETAGSIASTSSSCGSSLNVVA